MLEEEETGGAEIHPFAFYPEIIQWKLHQKENIEIDHLKLSIAISIIIDCACLVEGVLNTINKELIKDSGVKYGTLSQRLLELLEQRFEKGQFTDYINVYNTLIGKDVRELMGNELWKTIRILFTFRNNLVHGNVIEISEYKSKRGIRNEVYNNYKSIFDYIKEKKLVDQFKEDPDYLLFNDSILIHFYKSSIDFIKVLVLHVPKRSKEYVNEMTSFLDGN